MVNLDFKVWFSLFEADFSGSLEFAREIFALLKSEYFKPLAEALLAHGKKKKTFLNALDKQQIQRFISETDSPAQIAANVGGSSVAMYNPFSKTEYGSGLLGYERKQKMKTGTGWVSLTWNRFIKSEDDYKFKEFKTFAEYLRFIRSSTKAQYEVNSFDWLLYWLIMRLKISVQNAISTMKPSGRGSTMTADPQMMSSADGDQGSQPAFDPSGGFSGIDMPLHIKNCFADFFKKKKEDLEPVIKSLIAGMESDNFYNDAKGSKGYNAARIYLWYYLAAKFMAEKPDELDYAFKKLYDQIIKFRGKKSEAAIDPDLIRLFLHSTRWQKSEPVRNYIIETLKSDSAFAKLGLGSIAVSIFRNFVRCSDEPEPAEVIINSMPTFAGIKPYLNSIKDKITCGLKSTKISLHEDKPNPDAGDAEKVNYLADHFFKFDYPNWQFAEMQKDKLNAELSQELLNCMKLPAPDEEE